MYAIELLIGVLILGVVCIAILVRYLLSERAVSQEEGKLPYVPSDELIDSYKKILIEKADNQMHQLADWRELALRNCEVRDARKANYVSKGVSWLADYRSSAHEADKNR